MSRLTPFGVLLVFSVGCAAGTKNQVPEWQPRLEELANAQSRLEMRIEEVTRNLLALRSRLEAQESALDRHVDPVAQHLAQRLVRLIDAVLAEIGHRDELDGAAGARARGPLRAVVHPQDQPAGRHGVGHRAASPAAAADQGQVDRVVLRGVDAGDGHARQRRRGGKPAGGLDEVTS